uniref:50S ribosomal protein L5 n=1 Tax=Chlorella sorokiniana TaxID=3076 RepID=A0A076EF11_CHLSO|nr:50S ribosomal protein L5 [Chlorella sorokiniana]AII02105.1 50S ribosomal protein L5 [Chlorella sorokiniana]AIM56887.1 50S ribosomal protein L5 [Chlorella sorokiniana]
MNSTKITIKNSLKQEKKDQVLGSFFFEKRGEALSEKYYKNVVIYDLLLKQNYTSIMQLPRLEKLVVNTTSKIYINEKKHIVFTLAALELISGQKPKLTYARKSIANFKVRQHQIIGCRVTLRENQLYTFLDKLSKIVFPRFRDYSKKKKQEKISSFFCKKKETNLYDKFAIEKGFFSVSFGFQNLMVFPELENHYELVDNFRGMDVSFVVSNSNSKLSSLVLSGFQLPFFA